MITRRTILSMMAAGLAAPRAALADVVQELGWEDLIPAGVPYGEIIADGDRDVVNDTWDPVYDANASKLNETLDGALIKLPGYIIPLEFGSAGIKDFMLVPYVGACIHVPPPPPNQLVLVKALTEWPGDTLWDPVWVTGIMRTRLQTTQFGETGYFLMAQTVEVYEW